MSRAGSSSSTMPYDIYSDPESKWDIEITLSKLEIDSKYIIIDEKVYQTYIHHFLKSGEVDAQGLPVNVRMNLHLRRNQVTMKFAMNLKTWKCSATGEYIIGLVPLLEKYENDIFWHLRLKEGDRLGLDADHVGEKRFHIKVNP